MSSAKLAAAGLVVALSLSACGVKAKPEAGSAQAAAVSKQNFFSPLTLHEKCLTQKHVKWHQTNRGGPPPGYPTIQVRTRPSGPTVEYTRTPGAAQNVQMQGQSQGAEVIGSALLYPNQASDALLKKVELCVAKDVAG
jgi:hypothetical protein